MDQLAVTDTSPVESWLPRLDGTDLRQLSLLADTSLAAAADRLTRTVDHPYATVAGSSGS